MEKQKLSYILIGIIYLAVQVTAKEIFELPPHQQLLVSKIVSVEHFSKDTKSNIRESRYTIGRSEQGI